MARKRYAPKSHHGGKDDLALVQGNTLRMSAVGKNNAIWEDLDMMDKQATAAEIGVGIVLPYVKSAQLMSTVADPEALSRDMDLLLADVSDAKARRQDLRKRCVEAKQSAALHQPQDVFVTALDFGEEYSQHIDSIVRVCLVDADRVLDHFRNGSDKMDIPYVSPYSPNFHTNPAPAVVQTLNELNEPQT